jgi:hypothetical protein
VRGSTYKRCGCVDAAGKPLGADCPRRKGRNHGTWYYYAELPAPEGASRRRQRRGGFATQRDAQAALVDLLDRVHKRTHVEVGRQSVGEYLDSWMAGKVGLRASTRRSYAEHIRLYLKPGLGHHRLAELTTPGRRGSLRRTAAPRTRGRRCQPVTDHGAPAGVPGDARESPEPGHGPPSARHTDVSAEHCG